MFSRTIYALVKLLFALKTLWKKTHFGKNFTPLLASLVFHIKQRVLLVITICQNSTLFNFLLF